MAAKRTDRLNSLLKEVISDVIRKDVLDPNIPDLLTVTRVDITKDLRQAKVYVSLITTSDAEKKAAVAALQDASGYIAVNASKQVVMRYFPQLHFVLDDSVDKHIRIQKLLHEVNEEKDSR